MFCHLPNNFGILQMPSQLAKLSLFICIILTTLKTIQASVSTNEPNVFYVTDDTAEGHRIGRITYFNGNQHIPVSASMVKAVIVRASRPPAAYFRLDENTGDLFTRVPMDREVLCSPLGPNGERQSSLRNLDLSDITFQSHMGSKITQDCELNFQIALHRKLDKEASFHHLPEFADARVIIADRNDHVPTFHPYSVINLSIPESAPIGSRIRLPLATDPDSPEFSVQRYELYPTDTSEFSLHIETVDLVYKGNLKQEITDLFLELRTLLDREFKESYSFEVKAFDSPGERIPINRDYRNVLKVNLAVEDVNDNGPSFVMETNEITNHNNAAHVHSPYSISYKAEIAETTWPKSAVLQLNANDPDSSKFAQIRYEFASNTDAQIKQMFKLNENSGELFLRQPLDYEKRASYLFDILAIDNEFDHRMKAGVTGSHDGRLRTNFYTATAHISITVLDINDESPVIELDYLRMDETTGRPANFALLEENSEPPQFIADLLVTDRDANAANSHVICVLENKTSSHSSMDNKSATVENSYQLSEVRRQLGLVQYNLLTIRALDRERLSSIGSVQKVRVKCTDSGDPKKESYVDVNVHILDLNDNTPLISLISFQSSLNKAAIKPEENMVFLRENSPMGTLIARINITDLDTGENGKTTCSLLPSTEPLPFNLKDYFNVDPISCDIVTRKSLDRESSYPPLSRVPLTIQAQDHGNPPRISNLKLTVMIIDENDHAPMFQHSFYRFQIKENLDAGICVGQIMIIDLDGNYDQLSVRFHKQDNLPFTLWSPDKPYLVNIGEEFKGQALIYFLNTTKSLDREEKESYEFIIFATDTLETSTSLPIIRRHGYTATATIVVTVEDVNDNDPVIIFPQQPNKTFVLSNAERRYYQLMTVNANDKDNAIDSFIFTLQKEEDNLKESDSASAEIKEITKHSVENYMKNPFLDVDRSVGTIYLCRDMNINDTGVHVFYVIVQDSNSLSARTASLRFIVRVESIPPRSHRNRINPLRSKPDSKFGDKFRTDMKSGSSSMSLQSLPSNSKLGDYPSAMHDNIPINSEISHVDGSYSLAGTNSKRLTGDTVLILSLGLILLLLLATLCLVIFARHLSSRSNGARQSRYSHNTFCLCCKPRSWCDSSKSASTNQISKKTANNKQLANTWVACLPSTNVNPNYNSQMNGNCDTMRSMDTVAASLNDSVNQKLGENERIYYQECRPFSLVPIVATIQGNEPLHFSSSIGTITTTADYTALQSISPCQCCTPPPDNTKLCQLTSDLYTLERNKQQTLVPSQVSSNGMFAYYSSMPTPKSFNSPSNRNDVGPEKRRVRIQTDEESNEDKPPKNANSLYAFEESNNVQMDTKGEQLNEIL